MIKKLTKLADFKNKKILFSDEVLEELLKIRIPIPTNYQSPFFKHKVYGIKNITYSIHIDELLCVSWVEKDFSKNKYDMCAYNKSTEQEMHYSEEHGFYVEVEDENIRS